MDYSESGQNQTIEDILSHLEQSYQSHFDLLESLSNTEIPSNSSHPLPQVQDSVHQRLTEQCQTIFLLLTKLNQSIYNGIHDHETLPGRSDLIFTSADSQTLPLVTAKLREQKLSSSHQSKLASLVSKILTSLEES